jgi:hypothetical protein
MIKWQTVMKSQLEVYIQKLIGRTNMFRMLANKISNKIHCSF